MLYHEASECSDPIHDFCFQKSVRDLSLYVIEEIHQVHHQLLQADNLAPTKHINALFTKLVEICTMERDENTVKYILSCPSIKSITPSLQLMASQGEYELELAWARFFASQNEPKFDQFVYFKNYKDLVNLELSCLMGVGASLKHVVFIGSGPLPLSSILMYQNITRSDSFQGDFYMHNIDRDSASITLSNKLLWKLNISKGFYQHKTEAADYKSFNEADTVILGALVGQDAGDKMELLTTIGTKMRTGAFIMIRSAHSLRKLLYPSIEPHQVNQCGFETMVVVHPHNDIVNSILIAKKL